MTNLKSSAREARSSEGMAALARWGLAARGLVYLLIGWLAIQIALGHSNHQANQRGAFAELAS